MCSARPLLLRWPTMAQGLRNMNLYDMLQNPAVYNLKSKLLSLGRHSVRDYLRAVADLAAPSSILDVGCGTGRHAAAFSATFCGIDPNPKYIEHAQRSCRGRFLVMDATDLDFPDGAFDLVYCVGLCHHLSDRQVRAAAGEMKRVTKRGGQALIIDGVFPPKVNLLGYLLFKLDRGRHTRTLEQLSALLGQEGFQLSAGSIRGSFPYRRAVFAYRK